MTDIDKFVEFYASMGLEMQPEINTVTKMQYIFYDIKANLLVFHNVFVELHFLFVILASF